MRDILSKVVTGSMIAGAALLVAACGGGGSEANNTAGENLSTDVYNTDLGTENIGGDLNASGNLGTGAAGDLNAAANAVDNASDAISNAQSNSGQ